MDTVSISELRNLRADYAGRIDWYPKYNPRGATARAVYQTGQHRRRAQGQNHRHRVVTALITAPVRHPSEPPQQLGALHRGRRQAIPRLEVRNDTIDRCRAQLSDGRMHQQRSSGSGEVCERTLILPELRSRITATRRRSSIFPPAWAFTTNLADPERQPATKTILERPWRILTGAQQFCAIRSYLATASKHGTHLFAALTTFAEGRP